MEDEFTVFPFQLPHATILEVRFGLFRLGYEESVRGLVFAVVETEKILTVRGIHVRKFETHGGAHD